MSRKSIREATERFVAEIEGIIDAEVAEQIKRRLVTITESFGNKPMKAKKARKNVPRPCPVPGCKAQAFPRFHQLCKKHDDELSVAEGDTLRAAAERPGGKWYKLGIGKYAAADRKKSSKKKAPTKKKTPAPKSAAGGDAEF